MKLPLEHCPPRPLLLWDGDCAFCERQARRCQRWSHGELDLAPYQAAAERFPEIPYSELAEAVHLIEPSGKVFRGGAAMLRALAGCAYLSWLDRCYGRWGWFARLTEMIYRQMARHRGALSRWF